MRPYVAILKDSFREACSSRVLWILLLLILVLLLVLAGLHFERQPATVLNENDIRDGRGWLLALRKASTGEASSPASHIWNQLPDDVQEHVEQFDREGAEPWEEPRAVARLRNALNRRLDERDFYDAEAWSSVQLSEEAERLAADLDQLDENQLRRFNRLALDAAFHEYLQPVRELALGMYWYAWEITAEMPLNDQQLEAAVNDVLSGVLSVAAGFFGVFIAILVTASMIPKTFEPGEIDLLLSKPVARPLLFLTKFAGGCVFILLNLTLLVVGLWLILGWRFDVWNARILLCIPVFLFLFSIYYSVSAFFGVLWRNTILCIVMVILFWAACFTVGTTRELVEAFLNPSRIAAIHPGPDGTLLTTNKSGQTQIWNDAAWSPVMGTPEARGPVPFVMGYPVIGPVYDAHNQRLVAIKLNGFGRRARTGRLVVASQPDGWSEQGGVPAPQQVADLFVDDAGRILVTTPAGVQVFDGDPTNRAQPFKIAGFDLTTIAKPKEVGSFVPAGPATPPEWTQPLASSFDSTLNSLTVYYPGYLERLAPTEAGGFATAATTSIDSDQPGLLAHAADHLVLALSDGTIEVRSVDNFELLDSARPFESNKPRQALASPDGRWLAVLFHHRHLWLYDTREARKLVPSHLPQGQITAAHFTQEGRLLVGHNYGNVSRYATAEETTPEETWSPQPETLELVFRYAISPLYTVFPKPAALDSLVYYVLTGEHTAAVEDPSLEAERVVLDVWQPVWSSLAFVVVMLSMTGWVVWRRDF